VLVRDAQALGEEAADADDPERREDRRVFGLGLDADAIGPLDVPTDRGPRDADEEDDAGRVGSGRVRLVGVAVQELQRLRQLVIDLEDDRRDEQEDEAEVDARVHGAGGGVAEQRLHPHAAAEVTQAAFEVLLRRAAIVGCAALVVPEPERHEVAAQEQHHRDRDVERPIDRVGDVEEDLTLDVRSVVPLREARHDAGGERPERHEHTYDQDEVVGSNPQSPHDAREPTCLKCFRRAWARAIGRRRCYCTDRASDSRSRFAMPASSLREKPGTSSMIPANSR
jgi:hypothetical protein